LICFLFGISNAFENITKKDYTNKTITGIPYYGATFYIQGQIINTPHMLVCKE
jgi:hypothetical protein